MYQQEINERIYNLAQETTYQEGGEELDSNQLLQLFRNKKKQIKKELEEKIKDILGPAKTSLNTIGGLSNNQEEKILSLLTNNISTLIMDTIELNELKTYHKIQKTNAS